MSRMTRSPRCLPLGAVLLALLAAPAQAQTAASPGKDDPRAVHLRRIHPPEPAERIDWAGRITELLKEEAGDLTLTAVGDMIFNQPITHLPDPDRAGLFRIMQEADVAYGNMEFSLNDRPDLQRPFYNFRAPKDFRWELARTGINLVSMANNHALAEAQAGGDKLTLAKARFRCSGHRPSWPATGPPWASWPTCATGRPSTAAGMRTRPRSPPSTQP